MRHTSHRRLGIAAASAALAMALIVPGLSAAAQAPIAIDFVKDCPALTCTETPESPVDVYTEATPISYAGGILHYSALEQLSSGGDSVLVQMTGVLNYNIFPNLTTLSGTVVEGSWGGVDLTGARMYATATRLYDTTFGGTILIFPATAN